MGKRFFFPYFCIYIICIMDWSIISTILVGLLGGVNIFQLIYYKSQKKLLMAQASEADYDAKHKGLDLMQDQADYLMEQLSKLQKEYLELSDKMRDDYTAHTQQIQDKCNEIASLKSAIEYYRNLKCYRSPCDIRIVHNPNKKEESV